MSPTVPPQERKVCAVEHRKAPEPKKRTRSFIHRLQLSRVFTEAKLPVLNISGNPVNRESPYSYRPGVSYVSQLSITYLITNQLLYSITTHILRRAEIFMTKTWFITGTSKGFGREWAEGALERGDKVAATARNV
jgi:hypothetical protein